MKRIISLSLLFIAVIVASIFATDSTVTIDSVIAGVEKVVDLAKDAKNGGPALWLLIAAIINLLMTLMKFKPIAKYLNTPKMKSVKPYISLVLGVAAGIVGNIVTSGVTVENIVAGIVVGLSAIGIHECTHAAMLKSAFTNINNVIRKVSDAKVNDGK